MNGGSARDLASHWWAPLSIPSGRTAVLRLGPLTLRLNRSNHEWLLGIENGKADATPGAVAGVDLDATPPAANALRYVYRDSGDLAVFRPMLADRPVVVKPRQPVFVLPGQEAVFYISTPVWVGVRAGRAETLLRECPAERLSEIWFGPDTMIGELCYATPTHARHRLEELPLRPHRVVTPVRVENRAETYLPVEKLSLPVPLLSIYGSDDGSLWTESVHMLRSTDSDMATLAVDAGPPSHVRGAVRLGEPRQAQRTGLVRAFSGLFG